jgi:hypothetical protein
VLVLAVRLGLLDHSREPLIAERLDKLAVGVRIRKITGGLMLASSVPSTA